MCDRKIIDAAIKRYETSAKQNPKKTLNVLDVIENKLKAANISGDEVVPFVRHLMKTKFSIKVNFDGDRILFISTGNDVKTTTYNYINEVRNECNGLIVAANTWKPLVVPPKKLRSTYNADNVNTNINQGLYRFYKVKEGTTVNLYYSDKWIISTTNGYDMNNVKWNQNTYQENFTKCISGLSLTWESFTAQLEQHKCYTFGFRTSDIHKFQTTDDIWFIQSVNLCPFDDDYLWANDTSPIASIKTQEMIDIYEENINNCSDLVKITSKSIDNYLNTKEINLGYIIRAVNNKIVGSDTDIIIESDLFKFIKNTWYDNPVIKYCNENKIDRDSFITLNYLLEHYLDNSNTYAIELFQSIFPDYQDLIDEYMEKIEDVVESFKEETPHLKLKAIIDNKMISTHKMIKEFVFNKTNTALIYMLVIKE
jgi:hypothetical protein